MKVIEEYTITERKCPDNHDNGLVEELPFTEKLQKFCTTCGKELIEVSKEKRYEKEICPNCDLVLSEAWVYCPWCGLINC